MPTGRTYTQARANFARLCDDVTINREIVIIRRRGRDDVALIAADELSSLIETAHLLRSPRNASRLMKALGRALAGEGDSRSILALRKEIDRETEAR